MQPTMERVQLHEKKYGVLKEFQNSEKKLTLERSFERLDELWKLNIFKGLENILGIYYLPLRLLAYVISTAIALCK